MTAMFAFPSVARSVVAVLSVFLKYLRTGLVGGTKAGSRRSVIAFPSVGPCFHPAAVDTCRASFWTVS